jgi:hypothetical protein
MEDSEASMRHGEPYGVGVDCHSRFYQVCLRLKRHSGKPRRVRITHRLILTTASGVSPIPTP